MTPDSFDGAPVRGTPLEYTRIYRYRARFAHLSSVMYTGAITLCGKDWDDYLGTGSQAEYDHAVRLPLCLKCWAAREKPWYGDDPRLGTGHGRDLRDD